MLYVAYEDAVNVFSFDVVGPLVFYADPPLAALVL